MKSNPHIYFITTGLLGIVCALAIFLPLHQQQLKLEQQVSQEEAKLADFKKTLASLPAYVDRSADLKAIKRDLSDKLYTRSEVLSLLQHLYRYSEKRDLTVTDVTPPVEELLQLNRIVLDSLQPLFLNIYLKMDGDYIDFAKFVEDVEQSDFFRGTNVCQIIGSREDTYSLNLQFGFKVLLGLVKVQR